MEVFLFYLCFTHDAAVGLARADSEILLYYTPSIHFSLIIVYSESA